MQSKLASTAAKVTRFPLFAARNEVLPQGLRFSTTTGRTADPATHAVEPEEVDAAEAIRDEKRRHRSENGPSTKDDNTYNPPKSPIDTSPKLEHQAVGPLQEPITQQKRRSSGGSSPNMADVSCAGIDDSPWPEDDPRTTVGKKGGEEEVEDNREYFKHHKASPLSEVEFADTRKPVTRASDGGTQSEYNKDGVILWRPEQLDSAEDSLSRATQIFRENAARGDPDSPHGRVLRALRGDIETMILPPY